MARCRNCSAPLPQGSNLCAYCGSKNDVDLRAIHANTVEAPESDRLCPSCGCKMRTLNIDPKDKFLVEQCPECYGLFFDPGELEALLDRSVSNVYAIDEQRLAEVANGAAPRPIRYVKCPLCGTLMNRLNFGTRSGVIVDVCKGHGAWLDGGELRQLLEWRKAGGQLRQEEVRAELEKEERQKKAREAVAREAGGAGGPWGRDDDEWDGGGVFDGLLGGLLKRLLF